MSEPCGTCGENGENIEDCPVHHKGKGIELSVPEEARRLAGQYLAATADELAVQADRLKRGAYNAKNRISAAKFAEQLARCGAFTFAEMHLREEVAELTGVKPPPKRWRPPVTEPAGLFEVAS
ncbi:hypothetical protein SD37_11515 [Amycolatopsis orientalis]|uniref:Uncharacterized protein n=1 Tax=Amycolatopsis orientalis TaxID=31958 RepID=A0A193BVK0_AMYOR|nr:hypothetical protein [Amycolatopsis orientalis]ANN16205.1 hypothetical protein SD37_11515 [Amycolatopsis orientalis]